MTWLSLRISAGLLAVLASLTACGPSGTRGASGTYVAGDERDAVMLQIVESADHSLSGTLQMLHLKDDGRLESQNLRVTGAADGTEITLAIRWVEFLPVAANLSAVLRGDRMELTHVDGGEVSRSILVRGTVDDFVRWSDKLNGEAERLTAATQERRAEQDRLSRARSLTEELERVTAAGPDMRARLADTGDTYVQATDSVRKIASDYQRLAQRPGFDAELHRWDLEYALDSARSAAEQLHEETLGTAEEFDRRHARRLSEISDHRAACVGRDDASCQRLVSAADAYLPHAETLSESFAQAEASYADERRQQRELIEPLR